MKSKKTSLVITSISAPNPVLKACAEGANKHDIRFIVIGDLKSPDDFQLGNCEFYSIPDQENKGLRLAEILPKRHYARKNIGYLLARDSEVIIETDDDNFPRKEFWSIRSRQQSGRVVKQKDWVNVYANFSDDRIWPRGFPIEKLYPWGIPEAKSVSEKFDCPIQQGLADENPDVDAVYRLALKLPIQFRSDEEVILDEGSWCPFNSQNTTWYKDAFPLLYLPSYCSFRMTDIWRSFIAQRIAWTCGWRLLFHSATVWQERNVHNLLKDFEDEIPGYLNNAAIARKLEDLDLRNGIEHLGENLIRCYRMLCENSYVGSEELALVEAWLYDLNK